MKTVLKSKLQEIVVTSASIDYEGSLTLDQDIMDAMDVIPYEQVFINGKNSASRIMTYFIPGKRGSRCCEMNGGAANHFNKGDVVHLLVFKNIPDDITLSDPRYEKPIIVHL